MRILNFKTGHATNSSSDHTLLWLPDGADGYHDRVDEGDSGGGTNYGWASFQLASTEAKRLYMRAQVRDALSRSAPEPYLSHILDMFGLPPGGAEDSVDHQSQIMFPRAHAGSRSDEVWRAAPYWPDAQFARDLIEAILDPHVAVFGGNDNGDDDEPTAGRPDGVQYLDVLECDEAPGQQVARVERRDADARIWSLFSRHSGARVTIDLAPGKPPIGGRLEYYQTPQLVDIVLSRTCDYGCPWCYTDSQPGAESTAQSLSALVDILRHAQVFEVALGGGNPLAVAGIDQYVSRLAKNDVVPSMSVNGQVLLDPRREPERKRLRDCCAEGLGGLAFSCATPAEVDAAARFAQQYCAKASISTKVYVHHVLGSVSEALFREVLAACKRGNLVPTLLGFKAVGRGAALAARRHVFDPFPAIKASGLYRIGIDTLAAQEYAAELKRRRIPHFVYDLQEGVRSCAIDLSGAAPRMAVHSYGAPADWLPISLSAGYNAQPTYAGFLACWRQLRQRADIVVGREAGADY